MINKALSVKRAVDRLSKAKNVKLSITDMKEMDWPSCIRCKILFGKTGDERRLTFNWKWFDPDLTNDLVYVKDRLAGLKDMRLSDEAKVVLKLACYLYYFGKDKGFI